MNSYCLFRRDRVFYFRIKIPKALCSAYGGRAELKRSLKTPEINRALFLSGMMAVRSRNFFKEIRQAMPDTDSVKRLVDKHIKDKIALLEEAWLWSGKITEPGKNIYAHELLLEEAVKELQSNDLRSMESTADDLIADSNVKDIEKHSMRYRRLCRELLKSEVKIQKYVLAASKGEGAEDPAVHIINQSSEPLIRSVTPVPSNPLKTLIERYVKEKTTSGHWDHKTELGKVAVFNLLMEYFGEDIDVGDITRDKFLEFRNGILSRIPSNRDKMRSTRGKSLEKIMKMKSIHPRSTSTINDDVTRLSSFFKWCSRNDYVSKNVAEDMKIRNKVRADEERKEYDKEDLLKLIEAIKGFKSSKPHIFWIPLVSLFNGMRQSEICQLYVDDVVKDTGIDCFDINSNAKDKKIKNKSSIRKVPIHPLLLKLDFMGYVSRQKKSGSPRLWPQLKYRRDGYGQSFQRKFARINRDMVTKDPKKVFHSLRHNFSNNLKQKLAPAEVISELMGHSLDSITLGRYGKQYSPKIKLDALKKLDYGIDFLKLLN